MKKQINEPIKLSHFCSCGNRLVWSDTGGKCQECREKELRRISIDKREIIKLAKFYPHSKAKKGKIAG